MKALDRVITIVKEQFSDNTILFNMGEEARRELFELRLENKQLLKAIEPFAKLGNMSNDWPLPDSALICNVPFLDCKNALNVLKEYGGKE